MSPKVSIVIPTYNREKDLQNLLHSISQSSFESYEIIIVNNSPETLKGHLDKKIKVIENASNEGLAFARNKGAEAAHGDYILFIDDDNIIDKNMIKNLVSTLEEQKKCIAAGPLTYYYQDKTKVWFSGVKMNLFTSKPTFYRYGEIPEKFFLGKNKIKTDNLHNCFMVKKSYGDKVGWFDRSIFLGGTEFDLFMKIKKTFPETFLLTDTKAISYHNMPLPTTDKLRNLGFNSPLRVFYFQKNRGVLIGRYGNIIQKVVFGVIFYPIFFILYSLFFAFNGNFQFLKEHIKGTVLGYKALIRL
jgi:glycosyltransferase involved in cell wall biosynthesis